jgi:hypothetical protein
MTPNKQVLLKLLSEDGWELVSRDTDADWWAEEHWLIRSVRENWGTELVLTFLVDPQHEGHDKSRAIWAIGATMDVPTDRGSAEKGIALVPVATGRFNERLPAFIARLDQYRRAKSSTDSL